MNKKWFGIERNTFTTNFIRSQTYSYKKLWNDAWMKPQRSPGSRDESRGALTPMKLLIWPPYPIPLPSYPPPPYRYPTRSTDVFFTFIQFLKYIHITRTVFQIFIIMQIHMLHTIHLFGKISCYLQYILFSINYLSFISQFKWKIQMNLV